MSTSLIEEIREHFDQVEAQQAPVTAAEVDAKIGSDTATQPIRGRNPRGPLVAAAAAVLVFVAGAVSLLVGGEESPSASTIDTTPNSTIAPPTTGPAPPTTSLAPPTTLPGAGFAPRLTGSGVDVAFGVTPVDMTIAGESFVLLEAEWFIDWEGMAWDWGDDEIRQRIAASYRGHNTIWRPPDTLVFVDNADKGGEGEFARFTLTLTGTSDDFEMQVHEASTDEFVATVAGSLPALAENQIVETIAEPQGRAGWLFANDNGELTAVNPPWEPFYGISDRSQFFELTDSTLAVMMVDRSGYGLWNVWRSSDGLSWEDTGGFPWSADTRSIIRMDLVDADLLVRLGVHASDTEEYWLTTDGVDWEEISRGQWEATTQSVTGSLDDPEPPDQAILAADEQALMEALFIDMAMDSGPISENPDIRQMLPGPVPQFDTLDLGEEIEFEPLLPGDPFAESVAEEAFQDPLPGPSGPTLLLGPVTPRAEWKFGDEPMLGRVYELFWLTDSNGICGGSHEGGGCLGAETLGLENANADQIVDDGGLVLVPQQTAAVVVRYNADTALWQRPAGRWAFFPASVDGDHTYWIDAYDTNGNLIATTEQR